MSQLGFALDSQRFVLEGQELHCGDCFQVKWAGKWVDTRIEMSGGYWYLVGIPCSNFQQLEARSYERSAS